MYLLCSLFVTTLIVTSLMTSSVYASGKVPVTYHNQDPFIRKKIRQHVGHDPLLEVIAACESTGNPRKIKHWEPDGSLVKNPKSSASGSFQALLRLHSKDIKRLGLNMHNINDYMKFIAHLRKTQGYNAWSESKHCWGKNKMTNVA